MKFALAVERSLGDFIEQGGIFGLHLTMISGLQHMHSVASTTLLQAEHGLSCELRASGKRWARAGPPSELHNAITS